MGYKLLLADDSITIQKVVELVLAEEEFEIKSVGNGEDALNAMNTFRPDIVLADIEMPKLNGYQLCERIKQNPKTAAVPVILLAGAFEPLDEELLRKVGADDSVIKPFESQELISKINMALTMVSAGAVEGTAVAATDEEAFEIVEEAEEFAEAEAVEVAPAEEDLWALEEISGTTQEWTGDSSAKTAAETAGTESPFEFAEEALPVGPAIKATAPIAQPQARKEVVLQEVSVPSKEEILRIFEKTINEKVASSMASLNMKEALLSSLMPLMKDSVEKILWEIAPELVEKMLKEILKGSIASLTKEVEKVIWETVPDLAATMISKEIEKIKSEF